MNQHYVVGIDVGGTFTDFLVMDDRSNHQFIHKTSTTPGHFATGVVTGLIEISEKLDDESFINNISMIVHGTTVTTNAVLTNSGARTALVTTAGFRDVLQMRRGVRSTEHLYDNKYVAPPPLVPRDLRLGVQERIDWKGNVVTPVDEGQVSEVIGLIEDLGVEAVAVCLMHSYVNASHEVQVRDWVKRRLPNVRVSISSEVAPVVRLYERTSTVVLNAFVDSVLSDYLNELTAQLKRKGFGGEFLVMQSNGGVASKDEACKIPASTVLSGPAAAPVAGGAFSKSANHTDCIVVDMGGTSFDAAIVRNGGAQVSRVGVVNRNHIALPMVDIHTIGAGGGSIAWMDEGGILRVGPESAGAAPGPACYGRGGTRPTVSDANLLLGYLNENNFLGGRMTLDVEAARAAMCDVARPLGMTTEEAAFGVYEIVNLSMCNGIKEITVKNGYDPRDFPLLVAGGAGPIHAAMLAKELNIEEVIIPKFSSVLCAVGMLASDLRHDYVRNVNKSLLDISPQELVCIGEELKGTGEISLEREGVGRSGMRHIMTLDMRYAGQHFEVSVEIHDAWLTQDSLERVETAFHEEHERLYGYKLEGHELEIVNLRVTSVGSCSRFHVQKVEPELSQVPRPRNTRSIFDPVQRKFVEAPVFDAETFPPGARVKGPAVIEAVTTTVLVPFGYSAHLDAHVNFILRRQTNEMEA